MPRRHRQSIFTKAVFSLDLPSDPHHQFVEMPAACRAGSNFLKIATEQPAEFPCPATDGFITDIDASLHH